MLSYLVRVEVENLSRRYRFVLFRVTTKTYHFNGERNCRLPRVDKAIKLTSQQSSRLINMNTCILDIPLPINQPTEV